MPDLLLNNLLDDIPLASSEPECLSCLLSAENTSCKLELRHVGRLNQFYIVSNRVWQHDSILMALLWGNLGEVMKSEDKQRCDFSTIRINKPGNVFFL